MPKDSLEQLAGQAAAMLEGRRLVAFTGAGLSAESGIPTFRGAGGLWEKYDPAKYASLDTFETEPRHYWEFFTNVRAPALLKAGPNPGHRALAALEARGILSCVITQNVDGLHQEAGSKNVLEVHGSARFIACRGCGAVFGFEEIHRLLAETHVPVPACPTCGGFLKPTVVLFGEALPADVLREALEETEGCEAMLCVGSSLVVYPAAAFPARAVQKGAKLVIVNTEPTDLDPRAHLAVRARAGEFLPLLAGRMPAQA